MRPPNTTSIYHLRVNFNGTPLRIGPPFFPRQVLPGARACVRFLRSGYADDGHLLPQDVYIVQFPCGCPPARDGPGNGNPAAQDSRGQHELYFVPLRTRLDDDSFVETFLTELSKFRIAIRGGILRSRDFSLSLFARMHAVCESLWHITYSTTSHPGAPGEPAPVRGAP